MSDVNPYAPPKSEAQPPPSSRERGEDRPSYKLYTPGQVTLATFLGTPLVGQP